MSKKQALSKAYFKQNQRHKRTETQELVLACLECTQQHSLSTASLPGVDKTALSQRLASGQVKMACGSFYSVKAHIIQSNSECHSKETWQDTVTVIL